jgi:hypothetical protein
MKAARSTVVAQRPRRNATGCVCALKLSSIILLEQRNAFDSNLIAWIVDMSEQSLPTKAEEAPKDMINAKKPTKMALRTIKTTGKRTRTTRGTYIRQLRIVLHACGNLEGPIAKKIVKNAEQKASATVRMLRVVSKFGGYLVP